MAFSTHDIVPDSPTTNFCTLNSLNLKTSQTLSESNLRFQTFTTNDSDGATSTVAMPNSGKYYIEVVPHDTLDNGSRIIIGVTADPTKNIISQNYVGLGAETYSWTDRTGAGRSFISEGTSFLVNGDSPTYTANAIYQIFYDSDNLKIWMGKNNNWYSSSGLISGTPNFLTDETMQVSSDLHQKGMFFIIQIASELGQVKRVTINFGQDPTFAGAKSPTTTYPDANGIGAFYYQPPDSAKSLCTANLPDFTPTVVDDTPQDYFKAVLYTGQNADSTFIDNNDNTWSKTGVGFQPDFVFLKERSAASGGQIYDSCRGAQKVLYPNATNSEETYSTVLTSFDSGGFTLGEDGGCNELNQTYVAWCWKAGGPPDLTSSPTKPFAKDGVQYETLSAANITAGTITPTAMSVNTDAGFSIVKYNANSSNTNGGDVPHGLSKKPDMLIIRPLTASASWIVWHKYLGDNNLGYLHLDLTNNAAGTMSYWGTNGITTNSFGLYEGAYSAGTNKSDSGTTPFPHIAYCWHSVEGYSKFGSYTGNGSADGPFVYCGFRPAFVLLKRTDSTGNWNMYDSERSVDNAVEEILYSNLSLNENTWPEGTGLDFLSNGFKIRRAEDDHNATNGSFIFMAFAEQPFKYANAR